MARTAALQVSVQPTKRISVRNNGTQHVNDYRFIEKDPVLDICRTAVEESGLSYQEIADRSGVSIGTLYSWFHRDTKRPQHLTVKFVLDACEVDVIYKRRDGATIRGARKH